MPDEARKVSADGTAGANPEQVVQKFSPLPMGTRLGELVIQSVLGAGEFGITYIAVHDGNGRRFAVKEYLPRAIAFRDGLTVRVASSNAAAFTWGLDRFLNDGRALAKIKHAALIAVQSVFEENGTGYAVMVHEVGRDLAIWLHELRRPPTQLEHDQIIGPMLEGIGLLHAKEMLHLDILPANIIVRENGTPVLIDLGAARAAMRRRLNLPVPPEAKAFMAPEVIAGDQNLIGPGSDIYSLAVIIYLMATGKQVPQADKRVLRDELVPAAQAARGNLRAGFLLGIDRGLMFRPDDRPQRIATWLEDLLRTEGPGAPVRKQEAPADAGKGTPVPIQARHVSTYPEDADGADPAKVTSAGQALMDNPAFRTLALGLLGSLGGAIAGALASVMVASIIWSQCFGDSCVMPILPYMTAAGAVVGLFLGARYGRGSGYRQTHADITDDT